MKIIHGSPGMGSILSESETNEFLKNSKLNLRLGTTDDKCDPNIHPVWYLFENEKLYVLTSKTAKKARNIQNRNTVYFCIDEDRDIPKGVRGKASTIILDDMSQILPIVEKIVIKYTGNLDNVVAKSMVGKVKGTPSAILELTLEFFTTWDHGKIS